MKLLTLNTHSLIEPDYEKKLVLFAEMIQKEQPEIFALQEVNQTISGTAAETEESTGYVSCSGNSVPVKKDNHGFRLAGILKEMGCPYQWTWTPAKVGYDVYEEGLCLFSKMPIEKAEDCFISRSHEFSNWKTRKILGIQVQGIWYCSVHMGWWNDEEEPFARHWDQVLAWVRERTATDGIAWIMGDFNSPSAITGEGYEYVKNSGWQDTYELAEKRDGGITVDKVIDGWQKKSGGCANEKEKETKKSEGMRIDYIWCSRKVKVRSTEVICNGRRDPVVSDHYGVMITV